MVLIVYHDLNVCYNGRPILYLNIKKKKKKKKLGQNKYNHIKLRLLQFLQMLLILKINKCTSASKLKLLSNVHF